MVALRRCLPVALAALAGFLSHGGAFWFLPAAILWPACWASSERRWQAAACAAAYHLATSRGLAPGAAVFFGHWYAGAAVWLGGAAILAAVWGLLWNPRRGVRLALLPLGLLIVAVPPVGIVGWSHPLTAAGAILPGWGWGGLALTAAAIVGVAALPLRYATAATAAAVALSFAQDKPPRAVPGWRPVDTTYRLPAVPDFRADFTRRLEIRAEARREPADLVIFGESIGGLWTETMRRAWSEDHTQALAIGVEAIAENGRQYDNALACFDQDGGRIVYRQRQPVPVSMWKPGTGRGVRAHWFEGATVTFHGRRVAVLICYEQMLVWPVLHSAIEQPEAFVAIANDWWAVGTSIPAVQRNALTAWARLYDVPLAAAFNY